ncbi:hypothetical protein GCM10010401_12170 [Rarobacter faecitabidus]|uniref:Uncharacterized protein n=1 Tax=Rarobacter faecitabidus TaxID=13243 RepID=A0A542ZNX2_RARFA|nr:hypothetical protein [Rarobacter faecitabidus]TQL62045.1 hypothetical protein FB461_1678 [Rarobacter faecitabidus]
MAIEFVSVWHKCPNGRQCKCIVSVRRYWRGLAGLPDVEVRSEKGHLSAHDVGFINAEWLRVSAQIASIESRGSTGEIASGPIVERALTYLCEVRNLVAGSQDSAVIVDLRVLDHLERGLRACRAQILALQVSQGVPASPDRRSRTKERGEASKNPKRSGSAKVRPARLKALRERETKPKNSDDLRTNSQFKSSTEQSSCVDSARVTKAEWPSWLSLALVPPSASGLKETAAGPDSQNYYTSPLDSK